MRNAVSGRAAFIGGEMAGGVRKPHAAGKEKLDDAPIPIPSVPPVGLREKIHGVQATLPGWIEQNGPAWVKEDVARLEKSLKEMRFEETSEAADAILRTIAGR